ncbi:MAG: hypothetical protein HFI67_12205 [Lachnospiraceae bacterium]|jgi:hypothetical protein|nr:hypothetical protein [Lachnospiraceae bacterium]
MNVLKFLVNNNGTICISQNDIFLGYGDVGKPSSVCKKKGYPERFY